VLLGILMLIARGGRIPERRGRDSGGQGD